MSGNGDKITHEGVSADGDPQVLKAHEAIIGTAKILEERGITQLQLLSAFSTVCGQIFACIAFNEGKAIQEMDLPSLEIINGFIRDSALVEYENQQTLVIGEKDDH